MRGLLGKPSSCTRFSPCPSYGLVHTSQAFQICWGRPQGGHVEEREQSVNTLLSPHTVHCVSCGRELS